MTLVKWMEREGMEHQAIATKLKLKKGTFSTYMTGRTRWPLSIVIAIEDLTNGEVTIRDLHKTPKRTVT